MVQSFGGLMQTLTEIDFFTGLLPFVITYTVFFFMLRYLSSNVIFPDWDGNKPDQFAAILSIAFAFFTANFIISNPMFAAFFSQYLGRLTIIIVGLLGLLALLGFVGIEMDSQKKGLGLTIALITIAAFAVSGGVGSFLPIDSRNQAIAVFADLLQYSIDTGLIFILLIVGLLYYTMRDSGSSGGSSERFNWFQPFRPPPDKDGKGDPEG